MKTWGATGTWYQKQTSRYWDNTYIYGITTDETIGGMSTAAGGVYAYCYDLTLGGVPKGTWYVPTQAQLEAIWTVYKGMKEGDFGNYTAFRANDRDYIWSSSEYTADSVHCASFRSGSMTRTINDKAGTNYARCVRDSPATEASGQYVTIVDGYPVINLSELSPLGCLLTLGETADRSKKINSQTPSNTNFLSVGSTVSDQNGIWNAKMSSRFQVMQANLGKETDWSSAYNACKEYEGEGGKADEWRLPTQRELMVIWVLHPQLLGKGEFTAFKPELYSSCTEFNAPTMWVVSFGTGYVGATFKTTLTTPTTFVRCVRDLL